MTNDQTEVRKQEYLRKLESLHQVFLGLQITYACTIPSTDFVIIDHHFKFLNVETIKFISGKLYILLFDKKYGSYNTISFTILLENILNDNKYKNNECLKDLKKSLDKKSKEIKKSFECFRNKSYAHVELDENNALKNISAYKISYKEITDLLEIAREAHDRIFLELDNCGMGSINTEIEDLSKKLWDCYEEKRLVKKV